MSWSFHLRDRLMVSQTFGGQEVPLRNTGKERPSLYYLLHEYSEKEIKKYKRKYQVEVTE